MLLPSETHLSFLPLRQVSNCPSTQLHCQLRQITNHTLHAPRYKVGKMFYIWTAISDNSICSMFNAGHLPFKMWSGENRQSCAYHRFNRQFDTVSTKIYIKITTIA